STADSALGTDNSDLHDSPVRAKKWPNSYPRRPLSARPALSADPTKGSCETEQLNAFRWAILLLVMVIEGTTVNLLNHAVARIGRTEHELAEQPQLCVQRGVVLVGVFLSGHAFPGQSPNSGNSAEPWNATIRRTPSAVTVSTCSAC